jgi:hypothetical protein
LIGNGPLKELLHLRREKNRSEGAKSDGWGQEQVRNSIIAMDSLRKARLTVEVRWDLHWAQRKHKIRFMAFAII